MCACHGHSPNRCKRTIPSADISNDAVVDISTIPDIYVEITNADAPVRAALIANGITPMTCQEKGKKEQKDFIENKRRLAAYVKEKGRTLILIGTGKKAPIK